MIKKAICPVCGSKMRFIERCEEGGEEAKTVWTCDECEVIVYIVGCWWELSLTE